MIFHLAMFDDSRGYQHSLALFPCGAGRRAEPPCGRLPLAFQTDLQEHFRSGAVLDDAHQLYWNRKIAMEITVELLEFPDLIEPGLGQRYGIPSLERRSWHLLEKSMDATDATTKIDGCV